MFCVGISQTAVSRGKSLVERVKEQVSQSLSSFIFDLFVSELCAVVLSSLTSLGM